MPYYVPSSDTASTGFGTYGSGTGFYDRTDDYTSPDDTSGIEVDWLIEGSVTMRLSPTTAPAVDTGSSVTIRARAGGFVRDSNTGTINVSVTATLYEGDPGSGGAPRGALTITRAQDEVYSVDSYALSSGEKSAVTDWGNLYLKLDYAGKSGTGDMWLRISELAVEYSTSGASARMSMLPMLGVG